MFVSSNSICNFDEEYPVLYMVKYIPLYEYDKAITTSALSYQDNPLDDKSYKPGYQFESISDDLKTWDKWEVVFTDLFLPQQSSNRTYTGVIICGCKLISFRTVEESDKKIVQAFDNWDNNGNPIFQEIEILKP